MKKYLTLLLILTAAILQESCKRPVQTVSGAADTNDAYTDDIDWAAPAYNLDAFISSNILNIKSQHPYYKFLDGTNFLLTDAIDSKTDGFPYKKHTMLINIKGLLFRNFSASEITVDGYAISEIGVQSSHIGLLKFDQTTLSSTQKDISIYTELDNPSFTDASQLDRLAISNRAINSIDLSRISHIDLTDCTIANNARIDCAGLETLTIKSLKTPVGAKLALTTDRDSSKKTTLLIANSDASKLDIDYTKFHFTCFPLSFYGGNRNMWESDVEEIYKGIITSETSKHNQEGIKSASIELEIFKDTILTLGPIKYGKLIRWVKVWWNNYGFEKGKVVVGSTEVFFGFFILNCFIFRKLLNVYDFSGIKAAREKAAREKNKFNRYFRQWLLCFVYSGFVFYGVRFELSKLTVTKVGYVVIVVVEYIAGVVSLAYIANLIITK